MVEMSEGSGAALGASVSIADLEAALAAARERAEETQLARNVEAAEAKVEKIKGHLADAEQGLAEAKAALAAAKGN